MFKYIKNLIMGKMRTRKNSRDTRTRRNDNILTKIIKDDNNFNPSAFFLIATTIIGMLLLLVPLGLFVEMWFNHTIATDLNGMAAYIVAVVGIFTAGGLTHGWTEYSYNKFNQQQPQQDDMYQDSSTFDDSSNDDSTINDVQQ